LARMAGILMALSGISSKPRILERCVSQKLFAPTSPLFSQILRWISDPVKSLGFEFVSGALPSPSAEGARGKADQGPNQFNHRHGRSRDGLQ
jgi:hypothetical protein